MSKSSTTVSKITVKNVRVGDAVQSVRFTRNSAKGLFSCRTRGHTPIRIRFNADDGKFTAGNRSGSVTAKTADQAFARAAREIWAS